MLYFLGAGTIIVDSIGDLFLLKYTLRREDA